LFTTLKTQFFPAVLMTDHTSGHLKSFQIGRYFSHDRDDFRYSDKMSVADVEMPDTQCLSNQILITLFTR